MQLGIIRSDKTYWTPTRRLWAGASQGRKRGRLPGGHVMDLSDLLKAIMLCESCVKKFPSAKVGYVTKRNLPITSGRCDGCQQYAARCHLLVHHTLAYNC